MGERGSVVEETIVSKIISFKAEQKYDKTETETEFFEGNIKGKSVEEIQGYFGTSIPNSTVMADLLLNESTDENGGIIALSGFYFQFLVTIEYLIELLDGKWDYLLVDHHQDIVVINDKKIRFIQVKTKNVEECVVSKTKLYSEWIQKLFHLDLLFQDHSDCKTEFELVTNYVMKNANSVPVESYNYNDEYNLSIERNNFFKKIEECSSKDSKYEHIQGDNLEALLTRFKITSKETKKYTGNIERKLGGMFNKRFVAIKEDIDFLIGHICSMCFYPDNPNLQLITRENAERLKHLLHERMISDAREYVNAYDSKKIVGKYIKKLKRNLKRLRTDFDDSINEEVEKFENNIYEYFDSGGDIFTIISKFRERCEYSSNISECETDELMEYVNELFDIIFLVKMANDTEFKIDNRVQKILTKDMGTNKYSFFYMEDDVEELDRAVSTFQDILQVCKFEEIMTLFSKGSLKLILCGDFDGEDFLDEPIYKEMSAINAPSIKGLSEQIQELDGFIKQKEETNITKVNQRVYFINGNIDKVREYIKNRRKHQEISSYKSFLNQVLTAE
ncbi:TPA: DUF4297 domain-containing protein [Bacillus toyonensis]|uniref:dsDNA nuclease domain-containing protein n=1 Tax=Bacillus toyonensis TaxID=155322 RepID=UPI000BF1D5E6|nr:dsDNA nuclease domain-containing protein [Bacillus toyonensis]PEK94838.1 hypothetical protein CN606_31255 [Bacillus toyonensis]HDR7378767.1 DUF4297 domain-containing protein [Bacillus toyonensis]